MLKNNFYYKSKVIILNILILSLVSNTHCQLRKSDPDVLHAKHRAVYVEARNEKDGLQSGEFGDVVVIDLDTQKKYYVTNDLFYDLQPTWSIDGKKITFLSNRPKNELDRIIIGINGPYGIYNFIIDSLRIERVKIKGHHDDYIYLQWDSDTTLTYITENKIMRLKPSKSLISTLKEIHNILFIDGMSISPASKLITFSIHYDEQKGYQKTEIINFKDSSEIFIADKRFDIGGWSKNGRKVLLAYDSTLYEYDYEGKQLRTIFTLPKELKIGIRRAFQITNTTFVFEAVKTNMNYAKGTKYYTYDIMSYDIETQGLKRITTDGVQKEGLDVFVE